MSCFWLSVSSIGEAILLIFLVQFIVSPALNPILEDQYAVL